MRAARYVTGWTELSVSGPEPERFLRALAERGVSFWDAVPSDGFAIRLCLPRGRTTACLTIAAACGCEARALRDHGLPALFARLRRRRALLAGLFLAMTALLTARLFVWDIDVAGDTDASVNEVRAALCAAGLDIGASRLSVCQEQVRNTVLQALPELRWVTVNTKGCRVTVTVWPDIPAAEPVPEAQIARITAAQSGLVTEVRALRGTAAVTAGQTVLAGETLIEPLATGRYAVQGPTRAIGEVWARTWPQMQAVSPARMENLTLTGEKTVRFALILGKTRINFYRGGSICPSDCAKIGKEYRLAVKGVFSLPAALVTETLYTVEAETARREEPADAMCASLASALSARLGADGEVTTAAYTASQTDELFVMTLRAECLVQIGAAQPLSQAELAALCGQISQQTEEPP